jgi:hypothetical protein
MGQSFHTSELHSYPGSSGTYASISPVALNWVLFKQQHWGWEVAITQIFTIWWQSEQDPLWPCSQAEQCPLWSLGNHLSWCLSAPHNLWLTVGMEMRVYLVPSTVRSIVMTYSNSSINQSISTETEENGQWRCFCLCVSKESWQA